MELVEQLGSGIPRILRSYGKECFYFSENFVRMSFPMEEVHAREVFNVGIHVGASKLVEILRHNPGLNSKQLSAYFNVTSEQLSAG